MAATTRVNGSVGAHGTLFSVVQLKAFVIDAGSSLAAATGVDGALEQLIREVQPLMYQSVSTSGVVHVIVDGHGVDAASLLIRIKQVVIGQGSYGTLSTNISTCTEGTTFVVA